ncbi:MAG: hypothetical protein ACR2N0_11125, partial [Rubrobacteraceae bacterium]
GSFAGDPAADYEIAFRDASFDCDYGQSGDKTIAARIMDRDGGFTEKTAEVTVVNVSPTVDIARVAGDNTASEGETRTYTYCCVTKGLNHATAPPRSQDRDA